MIKCSEWIHAITRQINGVFGNKEPWQVASITAMSLMTVMWILEQIKQDESKSIWSAQKMKSLNLFFEIELKSWMLIPHFSFSCSSEQASRHAPKNVSSNWSVYCHQYNDVSPPKSRRYLIQWNRQCENGRPIWNIIRHCHCLVCPRKRFYCKLTII